MVQAKNRIDARNEEKAQEVIIDKDLESIKDGKIEITAEDVILSKKLKEGWTPDSNLDKINVPVEDHGKNPFEDMDSIDPKLYEKMEQELDENLLETIDKKGIPVAKTAVAASKALSVLSSINTISDEEVNLDDVAAGANLTEATMTAGKQLSEMVLKEGTEEITEEIAEEIAEESTKDALGNITPAVGIVTGTMDVLDEDLSTGERVGGALNVGADAFGLYAAGSPEVVSKTTATAIYASLKVLSLMSSLAGGAETRKNLIEGYGGSPESYAGDINWENIGYNTKMNQSYG